MLGKAQPMLGVSVKKSYYADAVEKAESNPRERTAILTKLFNIWTASETQWMDPAKWRKCQGEIAWEGRASIGLDLSTVADMTAGCVLFDNGANRYSADWKFWITKESLKSYPEDDRLLIQRAIDAGLVVAQDSSVIDYSDVKQWIHDMNDEYDVEAVGTDPWNARNFVAELEDDGVDVVIVKQSMAYLNDAVKQLERSILAENFRHPGYELMNWQVANTVSHVDPLNGNIRLMKNKSTPFRKIDGIAALSNAMALMDVDSSDFFVITGDEESDEEQVP